MVAPARMAASNTRHRKSTSDRVASSALNSTSPTRVRACATARCAVSSTSSGDIRSLRAMWMGDVAINVCTRARSAGRTASAAASTSFGFARASPQMTGPRTPAAMPRTPSNSPGEEMGNPASMTSTPSRASCRAISSFSPGHMEKPGDCSPSRRVVSKMKTLSAMRRLRAYRLAAWSLCGTARASSPAAAGLRLQSGAPAPACAAP